MPGALSRAAQIAIAVLAVIVFGALSVGVARVLGASTSARNAVIELVKLQSKGDERGVVARIQGCAARPGCVARVTAQVRRLRSPDKVRVLRVDDVAHLSLGSRTDTARVAWQAGRRFPVVQCVRVRRAGNPLVGYDVEIRSLSPPKAREAAC